MKPDSNQPVYFECSVCGECCSSWNIPVAGGKARALLERGWVRQRLSAHRRELVKVTDDLYRIPLTDENVCVFLGEDKRCLVEAHEGLALKPDECQRFPFATVRMPDGGFRHDTSASCKRIADKLLLAFQPILPAPDSREARLEFLSEPEAFPKRPWRSWRQRGDWQSYEALLSQWQLLFAESALSPEAALRQAYRLLRGSACVEALLSDGKPFPGWLILLFLRKPYGAFSTWQLLRGSAYDDPRVFGPSIDLSACRRGVKTSGWMGELDGHLNAFLFNLLQRKVLISRGQSLQALLAMAAVACVLVRWYAAVLAWLREADCVEREDLTTAIRLVERYYTGHQPRFLEFFRSRWRGALMARLLLG